MSCPKCKDCKGEKNLRHHWIKAEAGFACKHCPATATNVRWDAKHGWIEEGVE